MTPNNWKISLLVGCLALIAGILILQNPSAVILSIVQYTGIFIIIIGAVFLIYGLLNKKNRTSYRLRLVEGILNIILGIFILSFPQFSVKVLLIILGLWIIMSGAVQLYTYYQLNLDDRFRLVFLVTGVLSLAIGLIVLFNPFKSAVVITVLVGIYALTYALFSFFTAYRLFKRGPIVKKS